MIVATEAFIIAVAAGAVRSGTPVLLAALGEVVTERSGIINLGLEGVMLMGAWSGVAVTLHSGNSTLGIIAALAVGAILGLLHAFACVHFNANQVACGIAVTLLGGGLSAFLGIAYVGKKIAAVHAFPLPVLADIPVIGPILFSHDILVYVAYLLVPITAVLLNHTRLGIAIHAIGESPNAAANAGIRVEFLRYLSTALGGALAGLGGAYLSLVDTQGWVEYMTAGRGLIAVGLVIFAAWSPSKAMLGAAIFGGATSLQLRLQAAGSEVSPYVLNMVPYLLVIVVLVAATVRMGRTRGGMPAGLGKVYVRQA